MRSGKTVSLIALFLSGTTFLCLRGWPFQSKEIPRSVSIPAASTLPHHVSKAPADKAIREAEATIALRPQLSVGYTALTTAYMQKARESGDASYYGRAEAAVRQALALQADSIEALRALAWVQTGKHEFREALATAERLHEQLPNDPMVHGLLGDAAVELGEYERAEAAFQTMLELRPGLPSFSRAAYLRELYGDPDGAIELMERAVQAGSVHDPEPLAWCLVQLGLLYFNQGRLGRAETAYTNALAVFPQYYQALAALGRVRVAQRRYAEAIELYRQSVAIVPTPDLVGALGDVLALSGRATEAEKQYALVKYIEQVQQANQGAYNRQLALFYANHDHKLDDAVVLAETEVQRRHDIYSFDTLAWVYYKKNRFTDAQTAMTQALRLDTQDAQLLFHAGMIAQALGETEKAKNYLHRALEINPYFSFHDDEIARKALAELAQQTVVRGEPHVQ